jgi:general secretion pathway protein E
MRLLGEILQEKYGVSAESIEAALAIQKERGGRIGEISHPAPQDLRG